MTDSVRSLRKDSESLQGEHHEVRRRLAELDHALEGLICYSEVYADFAGVQCAKETAAWLASQMPGHFLCEEQGLFAAFSEMGPESAAFARDMLQQHRVIKTRVECFCKAAESFVDAVDLQQSIVELKDAGKALAEIMDTHMGAEERKYAQLR